MGKVMQTRPTLPVAMIASLMVVLAGCTTEPHSSSDPQPIPAMGTAYYAQCNGKVTDLQNVLDPIVAKMTAQQIPYTRNPANEWRDCSGNFLRLSSYLASACPDNQAFLAAPAGITDYRAGADNTAPRNGPAAGGETPRRSRDIARWYNAQGRFTPIYYDGINAPDERPADLAAIRERIRPGAVLWFSLSQPTSNDGLEGLFTKTVSRGPHINHMAVVTDVTRDQNGHVTEYAMYHGRTAGKPGSVTRVHYWDWPKKYLDNGKKAYPSLGYWNQYLVGIGTLVPIVGGP